MAKKDTGAPKPPRKLPNLRTDYVYIVLDQSAHTDNIEIHFGEDEEKVRGDAMKDAGSRATRLGRDIAVFGLVDVMSAVTKVSSVRDATEQVDEAAPDE